MSREFTSNSTAEIVKCANSHLEKGHIEFATACYRQVLEIEPSHLDCLLSLSMLARRESNLDEAADCMRKVILLCPHVPRFHLELGRILYELRNYEEAECRFREAMRLAPEMVWTRLNLGAVLLATGRTKDAEQFCREAVRLRPDLEWAHLHLGSTLRVAKRFEEAEACCRMALHLRPNFARAHAQLGYILLLTGRLQEGWPEREWGREVSLTAGMLARIREHRQIADQRRSQTFIQPHWNGEAINNKVLLLNPDEGIGDIIQFCRYASLVGLGARVMMRVPDSLLRLLSGLAGVERIVAVGDDLPAFDLQCNLMRLPMIFDTTLDTIPASVPYLRADPHKTSSWRRRLKGMRGLNVGLVWAGGTIGEHALHRSMNLTSLSCLGLISGVNLVSLQKGSASEAVQLQNDITIHDWTSELGDFADTAALVEALDLVISVDTSVAHLAGALGKTIWLLNRFDTCWRWLHDRDDSPWYPTMRIFRQPSPFDWDSVVGEVADSLRDLANKRSAAV